MTERKCDYCNNYPKTHFFSSYVLHLLKEDDEIVPVFCHESCMLEWARIRIGTHIKLVREDFREFCGKSTATERVVVCAMDMISTQGYADVNLVSNMIGIHRMVVENVLKKHLKESGIPGQYLKLEV